MTAITGETVLRTGITGADASVPATAQGVIDLTGSPFATLAFTVGGTTPSFTVIPLLWNVALAKYMRGDTVTITADTEYNIAANGTTDLYLFVSAASGSSPTLSVTAKPALL